jgi:hypothetical protein
MNILLLGNGGRINAARADWTSGTTYGSGSTGTTSTGTTAAPTAVAASAPASSLQTNASDTKACMHVPQPEW